MLSVINARDRKEDQVNPNRESLFDLLTIGFLFVIFKNQT